MDLKNIFIELSDAKNEEYFVLTKLAEIYANIAFYVFVGEFVVLVIGAILFKCLEKNKTLMNNYILE